MSRSDNIQHSVGRRGRRRDPFRTAGGGANAGPRKVQRRVGFAVGALLLAGLGYGTLVMGEGETAELAIDGGERERLKAATNRSPSDTETFSDLNTQVQGLAETVDTLTTEKGELLDEVRKLRGEITATDNLGTDVELVMKELLGLREEIQDLRSRPIGPTTPTGRAGVAREGRDAGGRLPVPPNAGIVGVSGNRRPVIATAQGVAPGQPANMDDNGAGGLLRRRTQQVIALASDAGAEVASETEKLIKGGLTEADEPGVYRTADYVPPNAYAPARIMVAVDAATGKEAQADPLAASFMLTGPARHVVLDGEVQTTDLTGCIVNGAARGDLSTERVFVKLARMTCPLPGGEVAVTEVQGHVTQLGKAGVRGRVVSRVSTQLDNAAIAGALSGLGNALGGVGRGGIGIGSGGGVIQEVPNAGELAIAAGGGATAGAADRLAEYYINQAESIQPVVAMPAGADVELVFMSGFLARPSGFSERKP